ncbi:MAG: Low affinity potassium transport system protein kup [Bacteroidia bacterium]|nr:Low affinity potassium transport system protein kup [Bacteroidia bacterium]
MSSRRHQAVTAGGLIVTLGIIFGDIGTSPLYVFKAIIDKSPIAPDLVLGGLSCIFWTLTLQTTLKYVIITLRADNKGEGGIFSLFALVRRMKTKWLYIPAILGGSTLLADGIITPPISVASAVEGLRVLNADIPTIPIVIAILSVLFIIQQFGTSFVGKFFGPVMFIWFSMLAVLGTMQLVCDPTVLRALNPYYGYNLLVNRPEGFWILGAVFLCTTGAEALYSDLGHCGRENIRITWIFVKISLLLNYFGQGAWLLSHEGNLLEGTNPFFAIMPQWFLITGIVISTGAAIVASQALISGSFTLINEAIRLNFWPKVKVKFPTDLRGQLYIPSVNWLLLTGCIGIVLYFKESANMEAAYGLAIVLTMLMTTTLLSFYMRLRHLHVIPRSIIIAIFVTVEVAFLVANLRKFEHGGWVTLLIASLLVGVMFVWYQARKIKNRYVEFVKIDKYFTLLKDLSNDLSVPKFATHLVYLTSADRKSEIESKVMYSILQKQPKRADIYWFVHVDVIDEPYRMEYSVKQMVENDAIRVDFIIGFRVEPRINLMFRQVVADMVKNHEVDITSRYESLNKNNVIGDFKFVVIEKFLSYDNEIPFYTKIVLDIYFLLKELSMSEEKAFGLDTSSVLVEKAPLIIAPPKHLNLKRVDHH